MALPIRKPASAAAFQSLNVGASMAKPGAIGGGANPQMYGRSLAGQAQSYAPGSGGGTGVSNVAGGAGYVPTAQETAFNSQQNGPGAPAAPPAAPGASAPAAPAAPAAPYSPTTSLTADQNANYTDWFANNDDTGAKIQNLAQQQAAQGNRKAAYLASMSGGNGGFYQSGQIAAGIAGQNAMQQGILSNAQARGQIYTNKAASLGALGIGAQNYGNANALQTGSQQWQSGENRIKEGREDSATQNTNDSAQVSSDMDRFRTIFKAHKGYTESSDAAQAYAGLESEIAQAVAANNFARARELMQNLQYFNYDAYTEDGHAK